MPKVTLNEDYRNMLTIYGKESHFNQYYHLESPFSFVLETYYKDEASEYITLASFTPSDIKQTIVTNPASIVSSQNRVLHQHDFYEFMYVLDGTVTNSIENTVRIYPKGSGCIVNRNLRHAERFEGNFRVFFLNLSKEYITKIMNEIHNLYFAEEYGLLDSPVMKFLTESESDDFSSSKQFLDIFPVQGNDFPHRRMYENGENISKIMLAPTFGSSHLIDGYIYNILGFLCDKSAFHTTQIKLDYDSDFLIFSRAVHLIEDTDGLVSRSELEAELHYSADYINRIIKKYSSMNLSGYCMSYRLSKAVELLKENKLSISNIAFQLGFKNRTHFYKQFKEHYGTMPSAFRG